MTEHGADRHQEKQTRPDADGAGTVGVAGWLVVLAGLVLRVPAAQGQLWLDEIWSWTFAAEGVFPRHDNNHPLNTLWMMAVGENATEFVYRLPALITGVLLITLAVIAGRQRSQSAGVLTGLLVACCYWMVHYSSEARGYMPMLLGSMGGYLILTRWMDARGNGPRLAFAVCAVLGLLSHLLFVQALAGFVVWQLYRLWRTPADSPEDRASQFVRWHVVPFAAAGTVYLAFVRGMTIGGGPDVNWWDVVRNACGLTFGLWPEPMLTGAAIALAAITVILELRYRAREGDDSLVFFATTIVIAPTAMLVVMQPEYLSPRYFMVPSLFVLILAGSLLSRAWDGTSLRTLMRGGALAAVLAFLALNGRLTADLVTRGRGDYVAAFRFIREHTPSGTGPITLASDQPLSAEMAIRYYANRSADQRPVELLGGDEWPDGGVDWIVLVNGTEESIRKGTYVRRAVFESGRLTGYRWALYSPRR